jgi:hypothetical protein
MKVYFNTSHNEMIFTFCAAVFAIGILSGRLACGNGNEKTLVLQWTNKKSKARKNKLIVANQVLLKDSNVITQKVVRKYLKNAKMLILGLGGLFIKNSVGDLASYKVAFEFEIRALTD